MRNDWNMKRRMHARAGKYGNKQLVRAAPLLVEALEEKVCLTATVAITDGTLLVSGEADGPIEISMNESQQMQVTDNGIVLDSFSDVVHLGIELDSGETSDAEVVLDIATNNVIDVNISLGNGTNSFTLVSGQVDGNLTYWGLESTGSDTVIFQAASNVIGNVVLELGDGGDTVELHGEIGGDTEVHGDDGDDTATVGVTGDLGGTLLLAMGEGTNSFTSNSEIGQVYYFGGTDADIVTLSATSEVQADARLSVSGGENAINVLGSVTGMLTVVGANDEESVTIDENASVGTVTNLFGVEDDHGHDHGEDGHSHGADFDGDGDVDFDDFLTLSSVFGQDVTDTIAYIDLDGSGVIDFADFLQLSAEFGQSRPIDITNVVLTNRSADCADYVGSYTADALDIQNDLLFTSMITITADETSCTIESDSVPNHEFNDESAAFAGGAEGATITATETTSVVPRFPEFADEVTEISTSVKNAIFLNGVRLDIVAAGCYRPSQSQDESGNVGIGCQTSDPWLLDALGSDTQFGVDEHNGHTQPGGLYHYHGNPNALFNDVPGEDGSPVIGFAADGFPVYGSYFVDSENDEIRKAISGYTLKEGSRGERSDTNPGGEYDGEYVADYEFTDAGDLDECNGMTIEGQYGYYITDTFPWGVRCLQGTPDDSFLLGGDGPGGGGPGGGGPGGGGPPGAAAAAEVSNDAFVELDAEFLDIVADDLITALATE